MTNDMITTPADTQVEQRRQDGIARNIAIPVESGARLHFTKTMEVFREFRNDARREVDKMTDVDYPIVRHRMMELTVLDSCQCMDMREEFDGTAKDMIRFRDWVLEEMQGNPGKFVGKVEIWLDQGFDLCSSIQMGDNYDYIPAVHHVGNDRPVWDSTNGWAYKKGVK